MKALAVAGMVGLLAIVSVHAQTRMTAPSNAARAGVVVDAARNLQVPGAYRTAYEFLGTWAVAADQGVGSKELHTVYASPGTPTTAHRVGGILSSGNGLFDLIREVSRSGPPGRVRDSAMNT